MTIQGGAIPANTLSVDEIDDRAALLDRELNKNIALNAFRIAINGSLTRFNLTDGVVDDFKDSNGLDVGSVSSGKIIYPALHSYDGVIGSASSHDTTFVIANCLNHTASNSTDMWMCAMDASVGQWVKVDFGAGNELIATKYIYHTRNHSDFNHMSGFKFQGSNNDTDWTDLDIQTSQSLVTNTSHSYSFTNIVPYRYYRLLETARNNVNPSHDFCAIAFLDICGSYIESSSVEAEAEPSTVHAVILADDAAITLNTDLKLYVSIDDGANWEQLTLSDEGNYDSTTKILTGSQDMTARADKTIKYKLECTQVDYEIYGVALLWD